MTCERGEERETDSDDVLEFSHEFECVCVRERETDEIGGRTSAGRVGGKDTCGE